MPPQQMLEVCVETVMFNSLMIVHFPELAQLHATHGCSVHSLVGGQEKENGVCAEMIMFVDINFAGPSVIASVAQSP